MQESEIILFIVKLTLAGAAAFTAILLWSRVYDTAWMALVAGTVLLYANVVYELLVAVGVVTFETTQLIGVPLGTLIFSTIPFVFISAAFIIMLVRHTK